MVVFSSSLTCGPWGCGPIHGQCQEERSAGYAGKKQEVKVHHDEGVANHIDPESCAVTREGLGEALTGERIGQPSSRGRGIISGADAVLFAEGETEGCVNRECPEDPAWSETLACAYASCAGPGRSHGRPTARVNGVLLWSASGRRGAVADDARS